jgi:nucleotide-binding universal stress UspA family protein
MKILLAIDDCDASKAATEFAHENFPHADIHIFSVADTHGVEAINVPEFGYYNVSEIIDSIESQAKGIAHVAEVGFEHADSATITTAGSVGRAICTEAAEVHADLVIVGQSHHSLFSRLFSPHVATYVLKHAKSPVLIVKVEKNAVHA